MAAEKKHTIIKALRYIAICLASPCEAYVLFLLCIRFEIGYWSVFIWTLLCLANLYALGSFPYTYKSAGEFSRTERALSFVGNFVVMSIWVVAMFCSMLIADGSTYQDEYDIIRHLPFVEAYMHENDMLDDYYESVINGPFSTSEEIAWAKERLAD